MKDLILEFSIRGSFFLEKAKLLDFRTIILVSLLLSRCVNEVDDSPGYRYDAHNGGGVCYIIIGTIFDVYSLKHS